MFSTQDDKIAATRFVSANEEAVLIGSGKDAGAVIELSRVPVLARAKKALSAPGVNGGVGLRIVPLKVGEYDAS